jgi:hypothetical protein
VPLLSEGRQVDASAKAEPSIERATDSSIFGSIFVEQIDPRGGGTAEATADFGQLKVFALAFAGGGESRASAASAQWSEVLTYSAAGMVGTTGFVKQLLRVDGSVSGADSGTDDLLGVADARARLSVDFGISHFAETGNFFSTRGRGGVGDPLEDLVFTAEIVFGGGQALVVNATVDAFAQSEASDVFGSSSAVASADLGHTVTWGPIISVTGAAGNPLSEFSVVSESGFDYVRGVAAPVPEPSTWVMRAAGLASLGLLIGRRRRWAAAGV